MIRTSEGRRELRHGRTDSRTGQDRTGQDRTDGHSRVDAFLHRSISGFIVSGGYGSGGGDGGYGGSGGGGGGGSSGGGYGRR